LRFAWEKIVFKLAPRGRTYPQIRRMCDRYSGHGDFGGGEKKTCRFQGSSYGGDLVGKRTGRNDRKKRELGHQGPRTGNLRHGWGGGGGTLFPIRPVTPWGSGGQGCVYV